MTLVAAGFPGSVNDIQWSSLVDLLGYDGTTGMSVGPASGDRTVTITAGTSNVGGILATNDGVINVGPLPANAGSSTRIDRIILRANWSNKTLTATFRTGTPSSSPQPPTLTRNPGSLYEVRLAQVVVAPGTGNLSSGDILQERVPPVSGFYNSSSFRSFPDADIGSLVWYTAANSLRIPIDGEYREIAHFRTEMRPEFVTNSTDITFTNTSPSPTSATSGSAPRVGVAFIAPPSGRIIIQAGGRIQQNIAGGQTLIGYQVRTGSTIGFGGIELDAMADRSLLCGEAVTTGNPARASGSTPVHVLSGLTPGSPYNAQVMHWITSGTGQAQSRSLTIQMV